MSGLIPVVVGVDVGGTNTDTVVITRENDKPVVLAATKELTTSDVTTGVQKAVQRVLMETHASGKSIGVVQVNIGTTHFVNAAVQGRDLATVSVLRLCGTVSQALPPFSDFPANLRATICCSTHLVAGGYRFDGRLIDEIKTEEIEEIVKLSKADGFVICGIFSPIRKEQELRVAEIIRRLKPGASITLSNDIGHIGLLERENAAILNECLKPLCRRTIDGFRDALNHIGLQCPIYLTQNDGTVITSERAREYPVYTFASGPTNSMRGAAFLSDVKDAIVVDIGGTTTDVGILKNGFPREAASQVKIGGVRTNFRMPDVLSIGLGGGSYVEPLLNSETRTVERITIGPRSAGYNLKNEAMIFSMFAGENGRSLTTTDIAVAAGLVDLGNKEYVKDLPEATIKGSLNKIHEMIEEAIDKVKLSDESLPVVLVGGGSILVKLETGLAGASSVRQPEHFGVANAIGAALCQVSGSVDCVVSILDGVDREAMERCVREAVKGIADDPDGKEAELAEELARKPFFVKARDEAFAVAKAKAIDAAVKAGADVSTIAVSDQQDMTIAYMPGQATRIKIQVVGDLAHYTQRSIQLEEWVPVAVESKSVLSDATHSKQEVSSSGKKLAGDEIDNDATKSPMEPFIDQRSGEWILSEWDVECIVIGAGIFGCGGGGSPHLGRLRAIEAVRSGKKIRIITPERLLKDADPENDLVSIVNFYGAPLIMYEQLVSSKETSDALRCIEDIYNIGQFKNGTLGNLTGVKIEEKAGMRYVSNYQQTGKNNSMDSPNIGGKRIKALMAVEIGGMNAIEPYLVGVDLDLPIVDADAMGRAFPKVSMMCPYMYGLPAYPAAIVDDRNRRAVMLETPSATLLEHHFRDVVTEMGCSAGCSFAPLVKDDVLTKCVQHTISRAWKLGNAILRARIEKSSPIQAIIDTETSIHVLTGKIRDVQRETSGGYNKGRVIIEGLDKYAGQKILINFQNEHLVIIPLGENGEQGEVIACVPDLITIVDADTAEPIPTEEVRYGMRVSVLVIASPDILRTETALRFVGPQSFQYPDSVKFKPFGDSKPTTPIPPM